MTGLDEGFLSLPLAATRDAALERAASLGCARAEVRIERIRSRAVALRDARLEGSVDDLDLGVGLRVVHEGAIGFAATVELGPDAAAELAVRAVDAARTTALAGNRRIELADEPVYADATWASSYRIDPTAVEASEVIGRLEAWSAELIGAPGVDHVTADLLAVTEDKHYGDLAGTRTTQRRVRVHPTLEALAIDATGDVETMRTLAPPVGRGLEYLEGEGWDFEGELATLPAQLAAKLAAPSVTPGRYDLVIDPTNLWLTIHESVGHATELDRALGYEAAYAGTSFATFDQLGSLVYGSELMNVTGDRTVEHGLSSIGFDDEGVAAQAFDLVAGGLLVGYQLDRRIAAEAALGRSNGCAFASSALMAPLQRMANVSLAHGGPDGPTTEELIAGVDHGIYVIGDKSWSIDMQRHNFQFTGQRFFAIENGRVVGQLRDVAYQSRTTDFWGSLVGLGGESTYLLGGAFNCGKGQPGQAAPVSHGCPSALFAGVNVLNARAESGR